MKIVERVWPGLWRDLILNVALASPFVPPRIRPWALRRYGMDVGKHVFISPGVWFGSKRVNLADGVIINTGCKLNTTETVSIGKNSGLGLEVLFITASHEIGPGSNRVGPETSGPIVVGEGVWIGARVTVLPGVTIEDGVVIAAGAVVTRDCIENGLYGGIPARRIKDLPA